MKIGYILTVTILLFFFKNLEIMCCEVIEEQQMSNLINDIIDNPAMMFETMEMSKAIDCTEFITNLKKTEWKLIAFTMQITRIYLLDYKYDGIDSYKTSNPNIDSYHYLYVKNKDKDDEDYIVFRFYKEGNKITFKGIEQPKG